MRRLLQEAPAPKVAVSPIVGGAAIKGPAAKMMRELGQMVSPLTVVDHFDGMLDGFVLDNADAEVARAVQLPTLVTATLMTDLASKKQLAEEILAFARPIGKKAKIIHRVLVANLVYALAFLVPHPYVHLNHNKGEFALWLIVPVKPFGEGKSRLGYRTVTKSARGTEPTLADPCSDHCRRVGDTSQAWR